ncbi:MULTISPECIES: hypothetical protein [unclassified Streptomyces]
MRRAPARCDLLRTRRADALTAAARADENGYRDDATAVVLRHHR